MLALGGAFEAIDELKGRLVRSPRRAHAPHRVRRADRRRRQPLHRDRRRRRSAARRTSSRSTPRCEDELIADVQAWRVEPRQRRGEARARRAAPGRRDRRERHAGHHRPGPRRRHHRRVGRRAARGVRRVPGARPAWPPPPAWPARSTGCAAVAERVKAHGRRPAAAARRQARASTATPTAPSRSPSPPATPAWRSSTRASASPPSRSRPSARDEDVDVIGLSILSGSHLELVPEVVAAAARRGRRRAGHRRRHHPRGRPAPAARRRASPPSTRRRTSSWAASWRDRRPRRSRPRLTRTTTAHLDFRGLWGRTCRELAGIRSPKRVGEKGERGSGLVECVELGEDGLGVGTERATGPADAPGRGREAGDQALHRACRRPRPSTSRATTCGSAAIVGHVEYTGAAAALAASNAASTSVWVRRADPVGDDARRPRRGARRGRRRWRSAASSPSADQRHHPLRHRLGRRGDGHPLRRRRSGRCPAGTE